MLQQLGMRAGFHHPSLIKNDDPVGLPDGGESVSDDHGGSIRLESVKGVAHALFAERIEVRGGLIQNQDGGILQESPCDRHPLALTSGEAGSAFAHWGLQTLGEALHEFGECRKFHRLVQLGLGGFWFGNEDVFPERVVEEIGVLGNQRDLGAQVIQPKIPQIASSQRDGPFMGIPEPHQQLGQSGFSGPRRADQRDRLSGRNLKADICKDSPGPSGVGEVDL